MKTSATIILEIRRRVTFNEICFGYTEIYHSNFLDLGPRRVAAQVTKNMYLMECLMEKHSFVPYLLYNLKNPEHEVVDHDMHSSL